MFGRVGDAIDHEIAQIIVADGFAGGELTIPKDQKCLPIAQPRDLTRERFEESRRSYDGIGETRGHQCFFEGELGELKWQFWILDAYCREQNKLLRLQPLRHL